MVNRPSFANLAFYLISLYCDGVDNDSSSSANSGTDVDKYQDGSSE